MYVLSLRILEYVDLSTYHQEYDLTKAKIVNGISVCMCGIFVTSY